MLCSVCTIFMWRGAAMRATAAGSGLWVCNNAKSPSRNRLRSRWVQPRSTSRAASRQWTLTPWSSNRATYASFDGMR